MELGLKDKIALVTGTGSQVGIGKAVALTLAREGCHIASCDVDLVGAEKTAAEVRALKRKAVSFKLDITDRNQIDEVVYINALGDVVPSCDMSYESQRLHKIGNVHENTLAEIMQKLVPAEPLLEVA